jgi:DNA repair protein RadC
MPNPYPKDGFTIKQWAEEDRPREKMQSRGKKALSDAELLAILLRSGSQHETALSLAQRLLHAVQGDLNALNQLSWREMIKLVPGKGLGPTKALSILAALELGNRRHTQKKADRIYVKDSHAAYRILAPHLQDLKVEECWVLYLNSAHYLIAKECMSTGGINGTVVDPRVIFKKALEYQAVSIVVAHNHPSGQLQPSKADEHLTKKLRKSGDMLDIQLHDHLIIGGDGYYSFLSQGKL